MLEQIAYFSPINIPQSLVCNPKTISKEEALETLKKHGFIERQEDVFSIKSSIQMAVRAKNEQKKKNFC